MQIYTACQLLLCQGHTISLTQSIIVYDNSQLVFFSISDIYYIKEYQMVINIMFQTIRGTFHQENPRIFPPEAVGKQCVPNCVMAIVYTLILPINKWHSEHLDSVLVTESDLYLKINSTQEYLLPTYILQVFPEFRSGFIIYTKKELFGTLDDTTDTCGTKLIDTLQSMVTSDSWMYGILCVGDATSASASAIFVGTNHCYIFDPHSKSSTDMAIDPGTYILLHFTVTETTCLHLKDLAEKLNTNQYDLTIIKISYSEENISQASM